MRKSVLLSALLALAVVSGAVSSTVPVQAQAQVPMQVQTPTPPSTATPATSTPTADGPAQTGAPAPTPGVNTTRYLELDPPMRTGFATATLDVSPAVNSSRRVIGASIKRRVIERRLSTSSSVEDDRRILRQETRYVTLRIEALQRTERRALRQYSNGSMTSIELLRTLAQVDAEARELATSVEYLETRVARTPYMSTTEAQLQSLQVQLAMLTGPVRAYAAAAFAGEAPPARVHVSAAGDSVALSAIRGNTYIREATKPSNLDANTSVRYATDVDVIDRIRDLYPWAYTQGYTSRGYTNLKSGVYRVDVNHEHGSLTSYIDGSTGDVFREVQRKSLARLPVESTITARANDTVVDVSASYTGGPVEVRLTDTAGSPVDGTLYVDGERVGDTRSGHRWMLGPRGEYTIVVQRPDGNVSVSAQSYD